MRFKFDPDLKIANFDSQHCSQITFLIDADILGLPKMTLADAESYTGFVDGHPTWPYARLAYFANQGIHVRSIDPISPLSLINDPRKTLEDLGAKEETVSYIMSITDIDKEALYIKQCLGSGLVTFETRICTIDDIVNGLNDGWVVDVSLNAAILSGVSDESYQQHSVAVTGYFDGKFEVQDSGLPARWDYLVDKDHLKKALYSPEPTSGSVILMKRL